MGTIGALAAGPPRAVVLEMSARYAFTMRDGRIVTAEALVQRPPRRSRGRERVAAGYGPAMRVGVVDMGTNTTRLLVAEVEDGVLEELDRRTTITRLGQGVDATGRLADEAMDRVRDTLSGYRNVMDRLEVERVIAVATSAMRDAANGPAFRDELAERYGIHARTISGDEEARLTFLGTTAGRPTPPTRASTPGRADSAESSTGTTWVIDIGGGSTEYVVGSTGGELDFHVSTQMGSVRHSERFLASDPPEHSELEALAEDVRRILDEHVPAETRGRTRQGIAVAGTATSLAAIDQELDPYDPTKVHGYLLTLGAAERIQAMLAALALEQRRKVTGLHPDRAPTIVAGATILVESIRCFGQDEIEISENDILHGAALAAV